MDTLLMKAKSWTEAEDRKHRAGGHQAVGHWAEGHRVVGHWTVVWPVLYWPLYCQWPSNTCHTSLICSFISPHLLLAQGTPKYFNLHAPEVSNGLEPPSPSVFSALLATGSAHSPASAILPPPKVLFLLSGAESAHNSSELTKAVVLAQCHAPVGQEYDSTEEGTTDMQEDHVWHL